MNVHRAEEMAPSEPDLGARDWLDVSAVHCEGVVWDARAGLLRFVDIPRGRVYEADVDSAEVSWVTSCCFGGEHLDELFVSTSTQDLSPADLRSQPGAGGMFRVRPGYRGRPGTEFRI